jgi:hypothetical protein
VSDLLLRYQGFRQGHEFGQAKIVGLHKPLAETLRLITATLDGESTTPRIVAIEGCGVDKGRLGAHALVPYSYATGGPATIVRVYDPNWPGEERTLTVNPALDSWSYDHGHERLGVWRDGQQCTVRRGLITVSSCMYTAPLDLWKSRPTPPWEDPPGSDSATYEIAVGGNASLLIEDAEGRAFGNRGGELANEMPGAILHIPIGVLPGDVPDFERYYVSSTVPLTFTMQFSDAGNAALRSFVPGGMVEVMGDSTGGGVADTVHMASDASEVSVNAGGSGDGRALSLLRDRQAALGWQHTVGELSLNEGREAALQMDPAGDVMTFTSDCAQPAYELDLVQRGRSPVWFVATGVAMDAGDTHVVAIDWTNAETATLMIDHGSDGAIDETVELPNEAKRVFLPVVLRNG